MKKKVIKTELNANLAATSLGSKQVQLSTEGACADSGASTVEVVLLPILPASPFKTMAGLDSRSDISFVYDADGLADRYNAAGRKANLNIEHNRGYGDTRSRGYLVEATTAKREPGAGMQDGLLYGWFALSELGREEMKKRLWLYTSAEVRGVWLDESTYQITRLDGHALTNNPAAEMPANFSADCGADGGTDAGADDALDYQAGQDEQTENASFGAAYTEQLTAEQQLMLTAILQQLGLPAYATQDAVLALLTAMRTPSPSEADQALTACGFTVAQLPALSQELTAAKSQVTELSAKLNEAQTEVQTLKAAEIDRQVLAAVDGAITSRKATPAQRESLLKLARADLSAFVETYANASPVFGADSAGTPDHGGNAAATAELTPEEKAFCQAYGLQESSYLRAKQQSANA